MTEGVDRGRARANGGVDETRTWKNSFLFTGEEPITKANSGGGSKNRVIEIAIDSPLVGDGHYVSSVVQGKLRGCREEAGGIPAGDGYGGVDSALPGAV